MKLTVTCTERGLVPAMDRDWKIKQELTNGEDYTIEIRRARNAKFLRKYMAFMKASFSVLPEQARKQCFGDDYDNWRIELEIAAGSYVEVYSIEEKKMVHRHRSISFSRMTEEEKKEYKSFFSIGECSCGGSFYGKEYEYISAYYDDVTQSISLNDWLNAHHFDYRGLIEKGLALEAPKEGMYKTK